jgi:chromosome segregation ATPase
MDILRLARDAARVRIARLEAEIAGADTVAPVPDLAARTGEPAVARLIAQEQAIFAARRDAYRTRLAALEQLRADLQTEVPAQRAMLRNIEAQVQSLREDLAALKGVVATLQTRSMEREAAKLDGERLRVETSLLRAQQEVSRADLAIIEMRTQRAQDLAVDLRETQAGLEQAEHRIATTAGLIAQAERMDPLALSAEGLNLLPVYSIVRPRGGTSVELPADETTAVLPGDAIKVELRRQTGLARDSEM